MMPHPEYRDESRVLHMCTYLKRTIAIVPQLKREHFVDGDALTERVLYNLMMLGEAANNVSRGYAGKHPDVDFRDMAGLRHKLVHDYANINLAIIWNVLMVDVPKWMASIETMVASLPPAPPMPDNMGEFQ